MFVVFFNVKAARYDMNNVSIPMLWGTYKHDVTKNNEGYPALYTSAMSCTVKARIVQILTPTYETGWYPMTIGSTFNWTSPLLASGIGYPQIQIQCKDFNITSKTYSGIWIY